MRQHSKLLGLALSAALTLGCLSAVPTMAVADEAGTTDEYEATDDQQAEDEASEEGFKGREPDSFRFRNGEPVSSGFGDAGDEHWDYGLSAQATEGAWRKNSSGKYVNDEGKVVEGVLRRGVDVSEWQEDIDWAKVKADDISYAIIRCGGTYYESRKQYDDTTYEQNAKALEQLGIPYGVYFFSTAMTVEEAQKEADFTIAKLKDKHVTLPVYYDLEYEAAAAKLKPEEWGAIARAFCDRIEAAGYTPGVYASTRWWERYLTDPIFDSWTRWVAQYYSECEYAGDYDMWQFSSSITVDGITTGTADVNFDFGVEAAMKQEDRPSEVWTRLKGADAIGTMAAIVDKGWTEAEAVVVASSEGYWDALSASSLAGDLSAPVLLTGRDGLHETTAEEIKRLGATTVYIAGGDETLTENVVNGLHEIGVENVVRVSGSDAAGTARAIAERLSEHADTCFVATASGYWDALSASPIAYSQGMPIFLTNIGTKQLDADTLKMIADNYQKVVIAGGDGSVPTSVEDQLKSAGIKAENISRKKGATAVETSTDIAKFGLGLGMSADHMGVASGAGYWDALTGASLCGSYDAVLVLANTSNRSSINDFVSPNRAKIKEAYVFGGNSSVKNTTFNMLAGVTAS